MNIPLLVSLTIFGSLAFLIFLAIAFPMTILKSLQNRRRMQYLRYAQKYGLKSANLILDVDPYILPPWEHHLLEAAPEPTPNQFYAFIWPYRLAWSLGLLPYPHPFDRWHYFKTALLGLLVDLGVAKVKNK